ncbi:unnamed protein product [Rhizophagus irregularis]|nr:unnamed protein product [Rhizophagus irregularis]
MTSEMDFGEMASAKWGIGEMDFGEMTSAKWSFGEMASAKWEEDLVLVKQLYSLPLKIKRVGQNKLIAEVKWDGALERDDEPVRTKFKCFSDAVTVKGPKHAVFGDRAWGQFRIKGSQKEYQCKMSIWNFRY